MRETKGPPIWVLCAACALSTFTFGVRSDTSHERNSGAVVTLIKYSITVSLETNNRASGKRQLSLLQHHISEHSYVPVNVVISPKYGKVCKQKETKFFKYLLVLQTFSLHYYYYYSIMSTHIIHTGDMQRLTRHLLSSQRCRSYSLWMKSRCTEINRYAIRHLKKSALNDCLQDKPFSY